MLETGIEPPAREWLTGALPRLWRWRAQMAGQLRELRREVRESPATFLLVDVGDGARVGKRLREAGIRVRDARSFGLARWIRLSAQPAPARKALLAALARCL
jgi:histidinol-phosphate/aromatic aminotransferase/cobyric acid decarboxylase-like protein